MRRLVLVFLCALWSSPVRAQLKHSYFQTSDGIQLHFLEAGEGPALVLIPGWTMPAEIWGPQLDYFSKKFHVVALDPRSQGESQVATTGHTCDRRAQDIRDLIDLVSTDSVHLVGWSLGGFEALCFLKQFGDAKIRSLTLIDHSLGLAPPSKGGQWVKRMKQDNAGATYDFVRSLFNNPPSETYLRRIASLSERTPIEAREALLNNLYDRGEWVTILQKSRVPVLYAITPRFARQAGRLHSFVPRAQVELFKNAGHALFVDEPDRFNRRLDRFLSELP